MIELVLAVLAGAITVAQGGIVFQPALSPDGTKVAYAADEGGEVSIYVAPTTPPGAARQRVVDLGRGAKAVHLAERSLLHRPWSAAGDRLLFLSAPAAPTQAANRVLFVARLDGSEPHALGPDKGLVENASWLTGTTIAYTYRESATADTEELFTIDVASDAPPLSKYRFQDRQLVVDLAPSPDGRFVALIIMSGARDERVRGVRVVELARPGLPAYTLEHTESANFLTWTPDSSTLLFIDTEPARADLSAPPLPPDVRMWAAATAAPSPPIKWDLVAMVALPGYILGMDQKGVLAAYSIETGDRGKDLGQSYVPVCAGAGRVALSRGGPLGAAVVVADVTKEGIESGDIGLPKPASGTPAPGSEAPPVPQSPTPTGTPGSGAQNGAAPQGAPPPPG